jgi:predicted acylesterase/phospholipase RssA
VVEAARATTAAPLFFEPVTLEASGATFVDGAVRANNPIQLVVDEAERLWPKRPFGCVVSVGTGWKSVSSIATSKPRLHEILKTLTEISTDANTKAREFAKTKLGTQLQRGEKYFRFFVPQGLEGINLADWERFPWMEAITMPYLSDSAPNILTCGKNLVHPSSPSKSAPISAPESILRLINDIQTSTKSR